MEVANKCNLGIIEDAAQSITSTYKNRKAGSIGTVGCAGDGGMIVANDEDLHNRLTIMRNHGTNPKYYHKYIGGNFRLDPIQAAVLLVKLRDLDKAVEYLNQTLGPKSQIGGLSNSDINEAQRLLKQ